MPPKGFTVTKDKYYDPYFAGRNISMPPPLRADSVTYSDGTAATVDQEAHDVVTFLSWAAEPKMEERKQTGFLRADLPGRFRRRAFCRQEEALGRRSTRSFPDVPQN